MNINRFNLYKYCFENSTLPRNVTVSNENFDLVNPNKDHSVIDLHIFKERYTEFKKLQNFLTTEHKNLDSMLRDNLTKDVSVTYDYKIRINKYSGVQISVATLLEDIFNSLQTSDMVPFIVYDKYIKLQPNVDISKYSSNHESSISKIYIYFPVSSRNGNIPHMDGGEISYISIERNHKTETFELTIYEINNINKENYSTFIKKYISGLELDIDSTSEIPSIVYTEISGTQDLHPIFIKDEIMNLESLGLYTISERTLSLSKIETYKHYEINFNYISYSEPFHILLSKSQDTNNLILINRRRKNAISEIDDKEITPKVIFNYVADVIDYICNVIKVPKKQYNVKLDSLKYDGMVNIYTKTDKKGLKNKFNMTGYKKSGCTTDAKHIVPNVYLWNDDFDTSNGVYRTINHENMWNDAHIFDADSKEDNLLFSGIKLDKTKVDSNITLKLLEKFRPGTKFWDILNSTDNKCILYKSKDTYFGTGIKANNVDIKGFNILGLLLMGIRKYYRTDNFVKNKFSRTFNLSDDDNNYCQCCGKYEKLPNKATCESNQMYFKSNFNEYLVECNYMKENFSKKFEQMDVFNKGEGRFCPIIKEFNDTSGEFDTVPCCEFQIGSQCKEPEVKHKTGRKLYKERRKTTLRPVFKGYTGDLTGCPSIYSILYKIFKYTYGEGGRITRIGVEPANKNTEVESLITAMSYFIEDIDPDILDKYWNVSMLIKNLELIYNINIVILEYEEEERIGCYSKTLTTYMYENIMKSETRNTVILFRNTHSDPRIHYEPIVFENNKITNKIHDFSVYEGLYDYILNTNLIELLKYPIPKGYSVIKQIYDSFGRVCKFYVTKDNKHIVEIYCTPHQHFISDAENDKHDINKYKLVSGTSYISKLLDIYKESIVDEYNTGDIKISIGSQQYYIPNPDSYIHVPQCDMVKYHTDFDNYSIAKDIVNYSLNMVKCIMSICVGLNIEPLSYIKNNCKMTKNISKLMNMVTTDSFIDTETKKIIIPDIDMKVYKYYFMLFNRLNILSSEKFLCGLRKDKYPTISYFENNVIENAKLKYLNHMLGYYKIYKKEDMAYISRSNINKFYVNVQNYTGCAILLLEDRENKYIPNKYETMNLSEFHYKDNVSKTIESPYGIEKWFNDDSMVELINLNISDESVQYKQRISIKIFVIYGYYKHGNETLKSLKYYMFV